ncbi:DUF5977 domain-containing protein [Flavitalea flava]
MKNLFFQLLIVSTGTLFSGHSFGQADPNFDNAAPPTIIPPSPVAAALFHDINVPINYYIGAQQTSIPLHTVKIGSLQMPISINYRATGIKVEEDAGWTGLEWDLVAAGAIGRSIVGKPDENTLNDGGAGYRASATYFGMPDPTPDGLGTSNWLANLTTCNLYNLALGKNYDLMPDNYFINFCGNSAKLVFDKNAKPYFSPFKAWKLTGNETSGFTVVTEEGTIYTFNLTEYSTNTVETLPGDDHTTPISGNTSWYLTKVISANRTDTISISYKSVSYTPISYNPTESYSIPVYGQTAPYCGGTPTINSTKTYYTHSIAGYIIQSITTRNQRVDFITNANRSDIPDFSSGMPYKLDSLKIYATSPGNPDQLIKKYIFQYDYYNNTSTDAISKRLRLLSFSESDSVNDAGQVYRFSYNSNTLPDKNSKGQDQWGYSNGINNNTTLIPTYTDQNNGIITYLGDRTIAPGAAGNGLLQQIQYPTGGTTSFEYECNRSGKSDSLTGVNTIYATTSANGSTDLTPSSVTFSVPYEQFVNVEVIVDEGPALIGEAYMSLVQTGTTPVTILFGQAIGYTTTRVHLFPGYVYKITATKSSTNAYGRINLPWQYHSFNPAIGNPIGGARIKRMVQSDGTTSIVKRFIYQTDSSTSSGHSLGSAVYSSYEYSPQICNYAKYGDWQYFTQHSVSAVDIGRTQGGDIGYSKVTILYGDNGENGKEELYYNFVDDIGGGSYPYAPVNSRDDLRGLLLQRVAYKSDGTIAQRTTNSYLINDQAGNPNYRQVFGCKAGINRRSITFDANTCPAGLGWSLNSKLYSIYQYWPTLSTTKEETFSSTNQDSVSTTAYFNYDSTNLQITKKSLLSSKGDSLITLFKYPKNFSGTAVYDSLISRNTIIPVVEADEYRNGNLTAKKLTNFAFFNRPVTNLIVPANIQIQIGSNALENRLQFNKYDVRGNLISQNKTNDVQHIYLYGYQGVYPVAEVINSDSASVAYTSFEDGTKDTWIVTGGIVNLADGITGSKSYILSTGNTISRSGLSASRNYILTYWAKGGSLTIGSTTAVSGMVKNGWTFYQHTLPAASTSVTITGAGITLDELRLYPADAQMNTYTYNSLIGMSSSCSAANQITYYEYDGLSRLLRIRDADKYILKQYDYQYQVPSRFFSASKSGSFTRSNCTAGGTSSSVTFTIPAGAYSSGINQADADAKAATALAAGGPGYANANGTCTFYNTVQSGNFTRSNCAAGGTPSTVTYTIAAGAYSSTVDQPTANGLASAAVTAGGPAYANTNGTCTFYNTVQGGTYTRNNCGTGGVGGTVTYTVPANTYSSTNSQAAADALALTAANTTGQANANANAICTYYNTAQSGTYTRNNCTCQYTGSAVVYTVAANSYSSTVDLPSANTLAINAVTAGGQAYANTNGSCTTTCTGTNHKIISCACQTGTYQMISQVETGTGVNLKCVTKWGYFFTDGTYTLDHTDTVGGHCP